MKILTKGLTKNMHIARSSDYREGNGADRGSNFQKPLARSRIYTTMDSLDYQTACYGESVA